MTTTEINQLADQHGVKVADLPKVLTHLWQDQGLGVAPFRFVCIISFPNKALLEAGNVEAYNNQSRECWQMSKAHGVENRLGICESCGMCLTNNAVIRDAHGKKFIVGCDCAQKTGDSKLITEIEAAEKHRKALAREAKREAEQVERQRVRDIQLAEQRERNGGLTDHEVQQQKQLEERNAKAVAMKAKNLWLIEVINVVPYHSEFLISMRESLDRVSVAQLPEKCRNILADIYAKQKTDGAKRGSKKYDAAYDEFFTRMEA